MNVVKLWPLSLPASSYTDQRNAALGYLYFQHMQHWWVARLDESERHLTDEEILSVAIPLAELSL